MNHYGYLVRLSNQFPILMKDTGIPCQYKAGFADLKKFYLIKEYLKNIC